MKQAGSEYFTASTLPGNSSHRGPLRTAPPLGFGRSYQPSVMKAVYPGYTGGGKLHCQLHIQTQMSRKRQGCAGPRVNNRDAVQKFPYRQIELASQDALRCAETG